MKGYNRFKGRRPLTAAEQYAYLRSSASFPGTGILRMGHLHWTFDARPTPVSRTYSLSLGYRPGAAPTVVVVKPDIGALADGRRLPHVYAQRPPRLCLYLPSTGEWAPHKVLAQTVVPWSGVWLFYFEDWLLTDTWRGGGVHPVDEEPTP